MTLFIVEFCPKKIDGLSLAGNFIASNLTPTLNRFNVKSHFFGICFVLIFVLLIYLLFYFFKIFLFTNPHQRPQRLIWSSNYVNLTLGPSNRYLNNSWDMRSAYTFKDEAHSLILRNDMIIMMINCFCKMINWLDWVNTFSTKVPLMDNPDSWFLLAKPASLLKMSFLLWCFSNILLLKTNYLVSK